MISNADLERLQRRLTRELAPPVRRRRPLLVDADAAGWIDDTGAQRLTRWQQVFTVTQDAIRFVASIDTPTRRSAALDIVCRELAAEGALSPWRDERYAIAPSFGAEPWFELERAAARYFGVQTYAVHLNGLVEGPDATRMWFARRSDAKAIDPGQLDNLVGGGIAAGESVNAALTREAWEEAGIVASLACNAQLVSALHIRRDQTDGLQHETLFVHDLRLPAAWVPANQDGEAVAHRCVILAEAAVLIAQNDGPDRVTADASLVVADCLARLGLLQVEGIAALDRARL